ncbi:hypothetical protein [Nonomuraea sp. SYSU D8015]|uniref:hypothetical protein n=1 Tax=Nonomuraea sp. SYSU D8015 TaxID=2593644 RepID=UPI001661815D|nr:hypothetical protein [Nonomuraea sp. SYSU D8015]
MNHLEERLRAALDARAETFEASPHAWARVHARRPRRHRGRLLLAALPVALLAVFVPVLLNGGLGRNTATDPDAVYERLMRQRTAVGEPLTVDDPVEGRPLRIWFAKARLGYPEVCYVVERAAGDPYGGCSPVPDSQDILFAGSSLRDGAATALDWGVAKNDVGAVTGLTKAGRKLPGTVRTPGGAPYRIWTVPYPADDPVTGVEYADGNGRRIGEWSRDMFAPPPGTPAGAPMELPDGVIARPYQADGTVVQLSRHGAVLREIRPGPQQEPVIVIVGHNAIAGLARQDVARVEILFQDGATTSLETRPDPWGRGVALFAGAHPDGEPFRGYRVAAYDASGKEVWSRDEPEPGVEEGGSDLIGQVMTLPGTENSGRPVRLAFRKSPEYGPSLCQSGGATPDNSGVMTCTFGGGKGFSVLTAKTYLPEPGAVVHYGPAGDDWEWVEAVLSDGRRVRAEFFRGDGAPLRIWHVAVPLDAEVGGYVMKARDATARPIPVLDKACGRQAERSEAERVTLDAGVTALLSGACMAFWENGEVQAGLPGPIPGGKLSDLLLDAGQPVYWADTGRAWYGYAPAGTAKVELALKGGATGTARAVPDPWGQGVTLFAGPKPEGGDFGAEATLIGYGADGKELWRFEP